MELKFLGRGAMLYPEEGNTSCYMEDENNFFLIDCGTPIADKLILQGKLREDKNYYVFITHTHCDHIGSLATLIAYLTYKCNYNKLNIVYDDNVEFLDDIKLYLKAVHSAPTNYNIIKTKELPRNKFFKKVEFIKTFHTSSLKSCGLIFDTEDGKVLYTSDIKNEEPVIEFINNNPDFSRIYIDTSISENPAHLDIETVNRIIPEELHNRVYCMHINDKRIIKKIKKYGFHVVKIEKK